MAVAFRDNPRWSIRITPRRVGIIFGLGLVLRLALGLCHGTQDMEWWKIWGRESARHGLVEMYGPTDAEVMRQWERGASIREIHDAVGNKIRSDGYAVRYSREVFPVVQPPVYLFAVDAASRLYGVFNPGLPNTRWFNFVINAITTLAGIGITLVIYRNTSRAAGRESAMLAALLIWLNPLMLLNGPIQGYLDQLAALFVVLSVVSLSGRKIIYAWVFLTVAVLTKPQAVLITPLVFLGGMLDSNWKSNISAWVSAGLAALLLCSPWILSGHFLGMPVALSQVAQFPNAVTVESLNSWWPVNYAMGVHEKLLSGTTFLAAFFGPGLNKLELHTHDELAQWVGIDLASVGLVAFACTTVLILVLWSRRLRVKQPVSAAFAAGMIVFGYFLFAKAVHTNHYFLMIPLFALYVSVDARMRSWFGLVVCSFLFQDLLFYGLGRDYNVLRWKLDRFWFLWITNLVSLMNLALYFRGVMHLYRGSYDLDVPEPKSVSAAMLDHVIPSQKS